jgi:hypothetical protein
VYDADAFTGEVRLGATNFNSYFLNVYSYAKKVVSFDTGLTTFYDPISVSGNVSISTTAAQYGLDYYNSGVKRWSLNVDGSGYFRFHPWFAGTYGSSDIFFDGSAVGIGGVPTENLTVYGSTRTQQLSATTISASTITATTVSASTIQSSGQIGSGDRIVQANSGGQQSATMTIVDAWLFSGSSAATILSQTSNWNYLGQYTGSTAFTATYQGQQYFDDNYLYVCLLDNYWRRTPFI